VYDRIVRKFALWFPYATSTVAGLFWASKALGPKAHIDLHQQFIVIFIIFVLVVQVDLRQIIVIFIGSILP